MRLGKEQAAGYVEDVETAPAAEVFQSDMERIPVTPEPQPTVAAG
ncbi:MAG TPA: hypothetical protein VNV62_07835 [Trebonia sp.]|jgi:hypothetical protein|nr:hypothetical protein [Trebonia sp.]